MASFTATRSRAERARRLRLISAAPGETGDRPRQILDVYVFQLRKKLERLGLRGAISTVRGFGYALVHVTGEKAQRRD